MPFLMSQFFPPDQLLKIALKLPLKIGMRKELCLPPRCEFSDTMFKRIIRNNYRFKYDLNVSQSSLSVTGLNGIYFCHPTPPRKYNGLFETKISIG
jgi:hypothetical protein